MMGLIDYSDEDELENTNNDQNDGENNFNGYNSIDKKSMKNESSFNSTYSIKESSPTAYLGSRNTLNSFKHSLNQSNASNTVNESSDYFGFSSTNNSSIKNSFNEDTNTSFKTVDSKADHEDSHVQAIKQKLKKKNLLFGIKKQSFDSIESYNSLWKDNIFVPSPTENQCSQSLQEKVSCLLDKKMRTSADFNSSIKNRKAFRNPSIYEKLVGFCSINEKDSNIDNFFNSNDFDETCYFDAIAKVQKDIYEKKEKLKKQQQV